MKRREFIAGIGSAAAWPLAAWAQQSALPVVGFLSAQSADDSKFLTVPFLQSLKEIGYVEGQNVAVEYRQALGMERVRAHERSLTAYMLERLADVPGLRVVGPPEADARGGLASFTIEGMHPHDIAELADRGGVCIRAGHHCAQPLMRCLGVSATARASVGVYNERSDIDALIDALQAGREVFGL